MVATQIAKLTEITVKAVETLQGYLEQNRLVLGDGADQPHLFLSKKAKAALACRAKCHAEKLEPALQKPIDELNLAEFVQLVTLLYSDSQKSSLASTTAQILAVFRGLVLSHTNYARVEAVSLQAREIAEINTMPEEAQAAAVTQVIKQLRESLPKEHQRYLESKFILDRVVQEKITGSIEIFTDEILRQIVSNRLQIAKILERGLYTDPAPVFKRARDGTEAAKSEPSHKKTRGDACNACGRMGHTHSDCSFVKQKHPDINRNHAITWADSANGKAWKAKGKDTLPGTLTLSGAPFAFEHKKPTDGPTKGKVA